nr:LRR receptor-like serine/threonine-protein kinase GSO2 [Ipomoea batatas]
MGTISVHQIGYFFIILFTFVLMDLCNCSGSNNMGVDGVDCCTKWEGVVCHNVTGHVVQLRLTNPNYGFEFDHLPKGTLSPCLLELKQLSHLDFSGLNGYFSGSRIPNFIGSFVNLQYLDLSNLGFQGIIPHQLGNLTSLHTLILNFDDMKSVIKTDNLDWLSNLSNLRLLDLSYVNLNMAHNWLEAINMLPSLRELHLSGCDLPKLPQSLRLLNNSLLEVLDLSFNIFNTVVPKWMFNLNNLVSLDLSFSDFLSPLPDGPWNLTSIITLSIGGNEMNGSLPSQLFHLSGLVSLNLRDNQFQGPLPNGPWNLTFLSVLDISENMLTGEIPKQIGNLNKLQRLNLNGNMLTGEIPKQIGNLSKLQVLSLYENMLTGEIPKQFGILSKLQELDLARNRLCGPLPENLGYSFPMIENLYILDNKLEGIVTENHFVNLTKLITLSASGNRLTMRVNPNWTPPFQLEELYLSGWNLGSQFPLWLQSQHQISAVDISNAGIEGEHPTWLWNFSSQIELVNVSHNQLQGQIQNISFHPTRDMGIGILVYLGSNQFSGPLPHISSHITELDFSNNSFSGDVSDFLCQEQNMPNNLRILHLGGNDLSGEIPDCWMHWPNLRVLYMKENKLVGSIPDSIGLLNMLESLDVHKNMLSGHIPPLLQNCTSLFKIDMGDNGFTGKIPRWLGTSLPYLTILSLRSNKFYGELPLEFCHLTSLRILDLSNNQFSGLIPRCFKNFTAMINEEDFSNAKFEMSYSIFANYFGESALVTTKGLEYEYASIPLSLFAEMDLSSNNFIGDIPIELTNLSRLRSLNLSRNNLTGNIPTEMGNMKLLESIDLSRNQLFGKIPSSFSSLYSLGVLDLSYNNLFGKIPSGTQLQGFNASCYSGNNFCGPPVSQNCSVGGDDEIPKNKTEGDDCCGVDWFYVSMAIGFDVGFWGICGSLFLVEPWRIAYFKFLDNKLKSFLAWAHALRT